MSAAIKIAILANARDAIKGINDTGKAAEGLGSKTKSAAGNLKKLAAGALAAGGVAVVGDALKDGVAEAGAFQDAANGVSAALKTNAKLQGSTADQIQKTSASIETLTGAKIDENDATKAATKLIRSGLTSQTDLDRAMKLSADVALGTGKDIGGVSVTLSKAFANPAKAAGVLAKSGVVLSETQKDALTAMVKTGDTAGAQGLIMDALEKKYAGAGKAAGTGLTADLGRAQDAIDDSKREIATALMPTLSSLATAFAENLPKAIAVVVPIFNKLVALIKNPAFLIMVGVIAAIVASFKIYSATVAIVSAATKVWAAIQTVMNIVLTANPIGLIVLAIVALIAIVVLIATKTTWFQTIWSAVWGAIKAVAMGVFNGLKAFFTTTFAVYKAIFMAGVGLFKAAWAKLGGLVTVAVNFKNKTVAVFQGFLTFMTGLPGKIVDGLVNGLKAGWGKVTGFLDGAIKLIPKGIRKVLGISSPSKVMAGLGGNITEGLARGIVSQVPAVTKAMTGVTAAVNGGVATNTAVKLKAEGRIAGTGAGVAGTTPTVNINISVAAGTDPAEVGRRAVLAIDAWQKRTGRRRLLPA